MASLVFCFTFYYTYHGEIDCFYRNVMDGHMIGCGYKLNDIPTMSSAHPVYKGFPWRDCRRIVSYLLPEVEVWRV